MSEFRADQARDIMLNKDDWNAEIWYSEFKDQLFQYITDASLKGHDHLLLYSDSWNKNEIKLNQLKQRLTSLGYTMKIRKGYELDEEIVISW